MSSSLSPPPPPPEPPSRSTDGQASTLSQTGVVADAPSFRWSFRPWVAVISLVVVLGVGLAIGWALRGAAEPTPFAPDAVSAPTSSASGSPAPSASDSGESAMPVSPPAPDDLIEELDALPPPASSVPGYDRALFGQAWFDSDRNGCDTRNDVLRRDLTDLVLKADTNGCKVLAGTLIDPYSGDAMSFVSGVDTSVLVQIDHVVPLAWAWDNGASVWTLEQRQDFANDPLNLLAVSGELNQEKSASGPASWLPPNRAAHCAYVTQFADVLVTYRLAVPNDDRSTLVRVLRSC